MMKFRSAASFQGIIEKKDFSCELTSTRARSDIFRPSPGQDYHVRESDERIWSRLGTLESLGPRLSVKLLSEF